MDPVITAVQPSAQGCLSADQDVRLAYEHAWLSRIPTLTAAAASALAHHIVAGRLRHDAPGAHGGTTRRHAPAPFHAAADVPNVTRALSSHPVRLDEAARRQLDDLLPLALSTERLLTEGGDDRLSLDPVTGLNRYGCAPRPRPDLVSFGSCTASSLSNAAFEAAERARQALIAHAADIGSAAALSSAVMATEVAILRHFGVDDLAQAILTASGTDAALTITALLASEHPRQALTSVLVSPAETGSGVPLAVQARHFAALSPDGGQVAKGEAIDGLGAPTRLVTVALRGEDGLPYSEHDVARRCEAAIKAAMPDGRVVLHAIDGSKTGLAAPGRATLTALRRQFGTSLDIVVDACQARIEPELVRWYVEQGFPVLLTGSKFFSAPGFCGVILLPRARVTRIADTCRIPAGIAGYASLGSFLGSRRCPGLLLRWAAALDSMARFAAMSSNDISHRLQCLGMSVRAALGRRGRLGLVPAPRSPGLGWSDQASVFTFTAEADAGKLSAAALRPLYQALQTGGLSDGPGYLLGQPVELGTPRLGGLRIAFSAQQVVAGDDCAVELDHLADRLQAALGRSPVQALAGEHTSAPVSCQMQSRNPKQNRTATPIPAD